MITTVVFQWLGCLRDSAVPCDQINTFFFIAKFSFYFKAYFSRLSCVQKDNFCCLSPFFSDGTTVCIIFVSVCSAAADAAVRQEQFSCVKSVLLCTGFGLDQFM